MKLTGITSFANYDLLRVNLVPMIMRALFEFRKMRTIKYFAGENSDSLVEADEEPPHEIDNDALETVLILALALHSKVVDEIHVMRKIVIDGSNTTGFQRTMLIATGGYIEVDNERVGVQVYVLKKTLLN